MHELCEEIYNCAHAYKEDGDTGAIDDAVDELREAQSADALSALHVFLKECDETLDSESRQEFVRNVLRVAEDLPNLEPLFIDPTLMTLID